MNCGFIGILGLPNVGKSTLLNEIIEQKISIVTDKPQTTRQSLSGIRTTEDYQLIFYDAPGFVNPKSGIFDFLAKEYEKVLSESDRILFVVSSDQTESLIFKQALKGAKKSGKALAFVFSKSDLEQTDFVKQLRADVEKNGDPYIEYSIKKDCKPALFTFLQSLADEMPEEAQPLYDPDMISLDRTRDIVAELIREQCFEMLQKEIPFGLGVIINSFKHEGKMPHIEANILVEKENHKAIVIGKKGSQLKKIGQESRKQIEDFLGEKIYLGLHVAFKKNWQKNQRIMQELGYHEKRR